MRKIKLSGKEMSVVRAIDFATGTTGEGILERTRMEVQELLDTLNGLLDAGFVETSAGDEHVNEASLPLVLFEVNQSYALELKSTLYRRL